jgi:hypothetical protein
LQRLPRPAQRTGATPGAWDFRGGEIPLQGWLAPSLADPQQAAVSAWTEREVVALLKDGRNDRATVSGPMALVVAHSTQHYREADPRASPSSCVACRRRRPGRTPRRGRHRPTPCCNRAIACTSGIAPTATARPAKAWPTRARRWPATVRWRWPSPVNVTARGAGRRLRPGDAGQPRPLGMPPFATLLSDDEIAAVVSQVRWRFGGQGRRHHVPSRSTVSAEAHRPGQYARPLSETVPMPEEKSELPATRRPPPATSG